MTISGILLGVLFATPNALFIFCAAYAQLTLVSLAIVIIVYDRGLPQAFCIAVITPAVLSIFIWSASGAWLLGMPGPLGTRIIFVINWVMLILIGLAGVGVRAWLVSNEDKVSAASDLAHEEERSTQSADQQGV